MKINHIDKDCDVSDCDVRDPDDQDDEEENNEIGSITIEKKTSFGYVMQASDICRRVSKALD